MNDWAQIDSHDLEVCLKAELEKAEPDKETVIGIIDELEKRDPVKEIPIGAIAAWDKFQKSKKRKVFPWRPLGRVAVVAVLVIALLGIVPSALGMENIFETVSRWTRDIFSFGETEFEEFVFRTDHAGLQELYDAVSALGITKNVVPTWLPDGYELQKLTNQTSPKGISLFARFADDKSDIQVFVTVSNENREIAYQKDDETVEVYEYGGVETYIIANDGEYCATWRIDNVECAIFADAKEDIYKMIDSIYRKG